MRISSRTGALVLIAAAVTMSSCWYDTTSISPAILLARPHDIDVDEAGGHLYIADTENNRIHHIELPHERVAPPLAGQKGKCKIMARDAGADAGGGAGCYKDGFLDVALFHKPTGIATDSAGNAIFVADSGNHCVRVIRPDKNMVSTIAGSCEKDGFKDGTSKMALFHTPTGLDFDYSTKTIYVADSKNSMVRVIKIDYFDPKKNTVSTLCDNGKNTCGFPFEEPVDVACNSDCTRLFIIDRTAGAIVEVDTMKKKLVRILGKGTDSTKGLSGVAVDRNNNVYVTASNRIWMYSGTSPKEVRLDSQDRAFGQSTSPATKLDSPSGLSVTILDGKIQLFVADTLNNQIRQISMPATSPPDAGALDLTLDTATADSVAVDAVTDAATDTATTDTATDAAGQ